MARRPIPRHGRARVGTEFGLYVSLNGGNAWQKWTADFPTASVMDLQIHPREHDLIVGTFGRSAYVLDDIRPLRAMAREGTDVLDAPLHLFDIPDAYLATYNEAPDTRFIGDAEFTGEHTASSDVRVRMDPRIPTDRADLQARQELMDRFMNLVEDATAAADRLRDAREAIGLVNDQLADRSDSTAQDLREHGQALRDSIEAVMEGLVGRGDVQGIRRDPSIVTAHLFTVSRYLQSACDAPEQPERHAARRGAAAGSP